MTDAKHDDGGPAYPRAIKGDFESDRGASIWDGYAKDAMRKLIDPATKSTGVAAEWVARESARVADAMIAERRKRWPK